MIFFIRCKFSIFIFLIKIFPKTFEFFSLLLLFLFEDIFSFFFLFLFDELIHIWHFYELEIIRVVFFFIAFCESSFQLVMIEQQLLLDSTSVFRFTFSTRTRIFVLTLQEFLFKLCLHRFHRIHLNRLDYKSDDPHVHRENHKNMQEPANAHAIIEIYEILAQIIKNNPRAHEQQKREQEHLRYHHAHVALRIRIGQLRRNQPHVHDLHDQQEDHLEHLRVIQEHNKRANDHLPKQKE